MKKIVMVAGSVKKDMYKGLSEKEAVEICEYFGWEVAPDGDGGFVWGMEIEEDYEERIKP